MLKVISTGNKNYVEYKESSELIEGIYAISETLLKNTDHIKRITMVDLLKRVIDDAFYQIEEGVGVK
jgi:hypothetical protein